VPSALLKYKSKSMLSVLCAANYAEELAKVVHKVLILCEVANLGREFLLETYDGYSERLQPSVSQLGITREEFNGYLERHAGNEDSSSHGKPGSFSVHEDSSKRGAGFTLEQSESDPGFSQSQRMKIDELLGAWYVLPCHLLSSA